MKNIIFKTNTSSWAPLFTRISLGGVLFAHGAQKLLGWFGGYGFDGTMQYFTQTQKLPWVIGFMVIMIEFFGTISLVLGFATRFWSTAILFLAIGIVLTTDFRHYFFMNWFGSRETEGMEFFLLMLGLAASLVFSGAGKFSIDGLIASHKPVDEHSTIKKTSFSF